MTTLSPLDRLEKLAAQRTARTDRLVAATHELLSQLDRVTEPGDYADTDRYRLTRSIIHTNVGVYDGWYFQSGPDEDKDSWGCWINLDVGASRCVHGDLHCQIHGPTRRELILFAEFAQKLVADLIDRSERELADIDAGLEHVATATKQAKS